MWSVYARPEPVLARDLQTHGAMTVLLRTRSSRTWCRLWRTIQPSSTADRSQHRHGCNSVIATKSAMKLADYVVTEAGSARIWERRSSSTSNAASRA